jgi:hypothetical protein
MYMVVILWCCCDVIVALLWCYSDVYKDVTRMVQGGDEQLTDATPPIM